MIIDDEPYLLDVAAELLNHEGYHVFTASSGKQALEIYREQQKQIDLILLDLTMPHMNGRECFHLLREINSDVRITIVSGYSKEDVVQHFDGYNLAGFIKKPYLPETLFNHVKQAMETQSPCTP